MAAIVVPGRAVGNNRPGGPFILNAASWQARGLEYWAVTPGNGTIKDMSNRRRIVAPNGQIPPLLGFTLGGVGNTFSGLSAAMILKNYTPPNLITVVAWVRGPNGSPSWSNIVECNRGIGGNFGMWKSGNGAFYHWRWSASASSDFGTFVSGANTMLVGVFDGTNAKAYQDGLSVLTTASSRAASTNGDTTFGLSGSGEPFASGGIVVEVRLYNYAWNDMQIWEAYSPETRWDLYWTPSRRVTVDAPTSSTAGVKNILHF